MSYSLTAEGSDAGQAQLSPTRRVLLELRAGKTMASIARTTGLPLVFVETLVEHYRRVGVVDDAGSLCSSGLGACHVEAVSDEVRVVCAGCPMRIR